MPNFTDLTIRALPEGLHFDERTPGFAIRIGKHRKTWLVVKQPNRTKVRIGHYPGLSLQEARRRAMIALGTPFQPRTAPSFPDALNAFLAQDRWRPSTKAMLEWSLRRHFHWQNPVDKISHEDVATVLDGIEGKSERAHAFANVRIFFNWCVPRYIPHSPCTGLKIVSGTPRARILSDDELRAVWRGAEQIGYPFGTIVMLLVLTGQRRGEISALQASWIKDDAVTLPAVSTKNGRDHTFPLGQLSASILRELGTKSGLLFPARGKPGSSFNGWSKSKASLDKLSGATDWTLHDLRRTFATNLAALGVPIHVTEKLLNHVSGTTGGIVGVYNIFAYWPEQVAAIKAWEKRLAEILR